MEDYRARILDYLLPLVPFEGWSGHALGLAAAAAGIDPLKASRAFAGPVDCINYFFACEDAALAEALPFEALATRRMPDRIEILILAKLERFAAYREAVRRAVAMYALPWNVSHSFRSLYNTVDTMWRLAGDTSTDLSYYSKRATLAGVYGSTLLCWLNDHSNSMPETREFLKHRLENVAAFGKWKKRLSIKFSQAS